MAASYRKTPALESLFNSENPEIFKSTYFEEHLRTAASENVFMKLRKIKIYVLSLHEKTGFFNISIRNKGRCLFLLHDWFPMKFVFT